MTTTDTRERGAGLHRRGLPWPTSCSPSWGAFAEFEHSLIREYQREASPLPSSAAPTKDGKDSVYQYLHHAKPGKAPPLPARPPCRIRTGRTG